MRYVEAFRKYDARPINQLWAVSAIADDGSLVTSCWAHRFRLEDGVLRYTSPIHYEHNRYGRDLLKRHLAAAMADGLPVRLIIVTALDGDVAALDRGEIDAETIRKRFDVRPDMVGRVVELDDDHFTIDFRRKK